MHGKLLKELERALKEMIRESKDNTTHSLNRIQLAHKRRLQTIAQHGISKYTRKRLALLMRLCARMLILKQRLSLKLEIFINTWEVSDFIDLEVIKLKPFTPLFILE